MALKAYGLTAGLVPVLALPAGAQAADSYEQGGFSLHGLTFIDAALLDGYSAKGRDAQESDVRLAEFGFTYDFGDWTAIAMYDFARDGRWRDVGVFRAADGWLLAAGQFKEPVSLDKMALPGSSVLPEAALFTSAFGVQRRTGVIVSRYTDQWSITGGAFLGSLDGTDSEGRGPGQSALNLRATLTGQEAGGRWHVGGWLRRIDYDGAGYLAASSPYSKLSAKTIYADLSGVHGLADTGLGAGVEAAWSAPGLHLAAEWGRQNYDGPGTDGDISGGYVSASWVITGEQRGYLNKKGAFLGLVPAAPFGAGGFGAVEITARVDTLDFSDFARGRTTAYTAAIGWTPRADLRVQASFTAERGAGAAAGRDSDVLMVRLQAGF